MKRIALALITATLAFSAAASEWFLVVEDEDGDRWLGKTGSLVVARNQQGVLTASGIFSLVEKGRPGKPFAVAIEYSSCRAGGGEMAADDGKGGVEKFWWSTSGKAVYDKLGETICQGVQASIERRRKNSGGV